MGGLKQWLAGLLAGVTSFFSPVATLEVAEAGQDYLTYPPLHESIPEDGASADWFISMAQKPMDANGAYYDRFFDPHDDSPQLATFTWYGTPGTGENALDSCTPVIRIIKFPKKDWENDVLNVLYTERTTFSQNICLTSGSGSANFEYIEFTYDKTSDSWKYLSSSYESDTVKTVRLHCAYIIGGNPLGGTMDEQYTGHYLITSDIFNLNYSVYNGTQTSLVKNPLYGFWLGYEGSGTPTPPDPPGKYDPDKNLNKDTDGDGEPDINIDTDDDGKADLNIDLDGDDIPDINIDTNGDKCPDLNIDNVGDRKPHVNVDTNGDGNPDLNIDTDNDGKPDLNIDTNGDNTADLNIDNVGDGKPHVNVDTNGDGKPDINIDTDGNGSPDLNIDTDGDNRPDINVDTNGDNKADINIDTDGDQKPDLNIDTNGDNKADVNIDTDGDQKPDVNIDTNGDYKPDINIDDDGDLIPDRDIDTDGDGKADHKVSHSDIGDGSEFKPDDSYKPDYDDWHLFNPFDYQDTYQNPFEDDEPYDPLAGWESPQGIPGYEKPEIPPYRHCWEPFVKPTFDANQN